MALGEMKRPTYVGGHNFKNAMEELAKNRHFTVKAAEKAIGLEPDFTEQVARGIKELTLEDVIKIANFFNTTMESVLERGNVEIRTCCVGIPYDELQLQYFKECIDSYSGLLNYKAMNHYFSELFTNKIEACKVELEKNEYLFMERFKTYMEEDDRKNSQPRAAAKCCDEVLINELVKRGFKVEKENKEDGKTSNKSSR